MMQQGPPPEVGGESRFPPYYHIDTSGLTLEIATQNVHRDYGVAFPLKDNTWRRIQREGGKAFFNATVVRQNRKLVPRSIVVLSSGHESACYPGQLEYHWFIRCSAATGGDTDAPFYGNSYGYHFLWWLDSETALAYWKQLSENDGLQTSSLVTDYKPEKVRDPVNVLQFEGSQIIDSLDHWIDRAFVASVSPWSEKHLPLSTSTLFDSLAITKSTQKRSDGRKRLFDMLPAEIVDNILGHVICDGLYGPGTAAGLRMMSYRRVCISFRNSIHQMMAQWTRRMLPLMEKLNKHPALGICIAVREAFVMNGRNVLDALAEWSRLTARPIEWDEHDQRKIYTRLRFLKAPSDCPPPAPAPKPSPPPKPKRLTVLSMHCVHGKRELEGTGVYATRRAKEQKQVKMRMRVPLHLRAFMLRGGWVEQTEAVGR